MDYFTKCNPPPTSCILCLLLTAFLSRYHVLHQHNRRQTNGELLFFFHSHFSLHCIIAALAFADVADPPARSKEKTQKEASSPCSVRFMLRPLNFRQLTSAKNNIRQEAREKEAVSAFGSVAATVAYPYYQSSTEMQN